MDNETMSLQFTHSADSLHSPSSFLSSQPSSLHTPFSPSFITSPLSSSLNVIKNPLPSQFVSPPHKQIFPLLSDHQMDVTPLPTSQSLLIQPQALIGGVNDTWPEPLASSHQKSVEPSRFARSLSGGERTYSTICFLLALWFISSSPFRAVDEFDVFCDETTRKTAADHLITQALKKNFQLILITPLDRGTFSGNPDIRILHIEKGVIDE
jgi:hypothetical protein